MIDNRLTKPTFTQIVLMEEFETTNAVRQNLLCQLIVNDAIEVIPKSRLLQLFQVIIPVFGDQPANAKEAEIKGFGLGIPVNDVTSDNLFAAVQTVLTDTKYVRRAQEHGSLLMDDMTKPLDRAVWWIEYALRHPGMEHLRSVRN